MFVSIIFMSGCNSAINNNLSTNTIPGTTIDSNPLANNIFITTELPKITDFSEVEYENYETHFSPVKSAFYRYSDIDEIIANDDPRLLQLLNFIAYSSENTLDVWRQGYVLEDELNNYMSADYPMLEITFFNERGHSGSVIGDTPKIVICGDYYLAFADPTIKNNGMNGVFAEQVFPYGELATDNNFTDVSTNRLDSNCWLNILEYTGF